MNKKDLVKFLKNKKTGYTLAELSKMKKKELEELFEDYNCNSDMYPNGRDFEAEDEDSF